MSWSAGPKLRICHMVNHAQPIAPWRRPSPQRSGETIALHCKKVALVLHRPVAWSSPPAFTGDSREAVLSEAWTLCRARREELAVGRVWTPDSGAGSSTAVRSSSPGGTRVDETAEG